MVDASGQAAAFCALARWATAVEVAALDQPLPTVTITANMPAKDLLNLLKVFSDAAA